MDCGAGASASPLSPSAAPGMTLEGQPIRRRDAPRGSTQASPAGAPWLVWKTGCKCTLRRPTGLPLPPQHTRLLFLSGSLLSFKKRCNHFLSLHHGTKSLQDPAWLQQPWQYSPATASGCSELERAGEGGVCRQAPGSLRRCVPWEAAVSPALPEACCTSLERFAPTSVLPRGHN